jgi:hypothetical protein
MAKHIFRRLIAILIGIFATFLLFFVLWSKPSEALGAAIISIFTGAIIGFCLIIYFFIESVSLFKKQNKKFGIANFIIGLLLLIIILFIINNTIFRAF